MKVASLSCFFAFAATSAKAFAPSIGSVSTAAAARSISASSFSLTTVRHMTSSSSSSSSKTDFITNEINSNQVTIFSKTFCPFCSKTKAAFAELGVEATIFELNQMDDGPEIQDTLLEMTGQKTVPNVFVNGKHVGGNDDTQKVIASGEMKKLLDL